MRCRRQEHLIVRLADEYGLGCEQTYASALRIKPQLRAAERRNLDQAVRDLVTIFDAMGAPPMHCMHRIGGIVARTDRLSERKIHQHP